VTTRFTLLDLAVLVAYLAGTTTLGLFIGRRQRNSTDYFVAGRSIPWWVVCF
jgi:SSS family solute:Na+ symporter